jgi:hypothetical protein
MCSLLRLISSLAAYSELLMVAIYIQKLSFYLMLKIEAAVTLTRPSEQSEHSVCTLVHVKSTEWWRMIEQVVFFN